MPSTGLLMAVLGINKTFILYYSARMSILSSIFKSPPKTAGMDTPPKYPPFVKGLPTTTPDRLLSDHDVLMRKIYQAVRGSNKEYRALYLPLMRRYAAFVHLLPASECHHHRGAGGLLRHGLEVGFWALQQCESAVFALESRPEIRRQATLRWEFAVFSAGLCHDVGKCVSDMAVVDKTGKHEWNPFEESLYGWLTRQKIENYHIRWRDARHGRHEKIAPLVLDRVFPQKGRVYLAEVGPGPLEGMIRAMNGALDGGTENQVYTMVNKADRASVEHDIKNQPTDSVSVGHVGTPVVVSIFDAMRQLIRKKTWAVNKHGSRIWFKDGRIFLAWPESAADISAQIERDQVPGIPRDPDTIADILFDREQAVPYHKVQGEPLRRYWTIVPAILGTPEKPHKLTALELTNPSALLDPVPKSADIRILDPINDLEPETTTSATTGKKSKKANPVSTPVLVNIPVPPGKEPAEDKKPTSKTSKAPVRGSAPKAAVKLKPKQTNEDLTDIFKADFEQQANLNLFPEEEGGADPSLPDDDAQQVLGTTKHNLELFAEGETLAGEVMVALADDVKSKKKRWQRDIVLTPESLVAIVYPSVVEYYGLPAEELLQGLKEQDWLESSPQNPLVSCMKVSNYKDGNGTDRTKTSIILTEEATATFLLLAETTEEEVHKKQNQITGDKKATEQKPKQNKKKHRKRPKKTAKDYPDGTSPQSPPQPEMRKLKAELLAGGATLTPEPEVVVETAIGGETVVDAAGGANSQSTKEKIIEILLSLPDELKWQQDEDSSFDSLSNLTVYLRKKMKTEGHGTMNKGELIGLLNSAQPTIRLKMRNRTRYVHVTKEQ